MLSLTNSDAALKGTGKWLSKEGDSSSTSLAYTLEVADAGKLLDRFGFAGVLRGGQGKMNGELNWNGLPFSIDIPTLSGKMQLDMAAGQFLKVDPGAAKLLGVLSLQSLPRRLTLDFRDVFSEGFAFDGVTASADIAHGLVKTDNLKNAQHQCHRADGWQRRYCEGNAEPARGRDPGNQCRRGLGCLCAGD
ncbi:AsmA-like C-terminal region-containing protein [Undibacterium arcticum]